MTKDNMKKFFESQNEKLRELVKIKREREKKDNDVKIEVLENSKENQNEQTNCGNTYRPTPRIPENSQIPLASLSRQIRSGTIDSVSII